MLRPDGGVAANVSAAHAAPPHGASHTQLPPAHTPFKLQSTSVAQSTSAVLGLAREMLSKTERSEKRAYILRTMQGTAVPAAVGARLHTEKRGCDAETNHDYVFLRPQCSAAKPSAHLHDEQVHHHHAL